MGWCTHERTRHIQHTHVLRGPVRLLSTKPQEKAIHLLQENKCSFPLEKLLVWHLRGVVNMIDYKIPHCPGSYNKVLLKLIHTHPQSYVPAPRKRKTCYFLKFFLPTAACQISFSSTQYFWHLYHNMPVK